MKAILQISILFFCTQIWANEIPHIPLDASGSTYMSSSRVEVPYRLFEVNDAVEPVIKMGERNLQWLEHLNQNLQDKISISSPEKMQAFPIESPRIYNESIVLQEYNDVKNNMPREMHEVIFNNKAFTNTLPIERQRYEEWALKIDRSYQIAARWRTMLPYLNQLAMRKSADVRGYFFLKDIQDLDSKLKDFKNIKSDETDKYKEALVRICINSGSNENTCASKLNSAINNDKVLEYKNTYWTKATQTWNQYFVIPSNGTYPAIEWPVTRPNIARVPFDRPKDPVLAQFLVDNIEDEWQWQNWQLKVAYDLSSLYAIDVRFVPGVTPHVPGLGSNIIYMDANAPLTEWDVQWTIRHEFGHNLGFPDCYHEFYDTNKKVIIGYQIDINDLMCSRRGVLKERHFLQMKDTYF